MSTIHLVRHPHGWLVDAHVLGVTLHSRQVTPGHVFAATVGRTHDGHQFIRDAIRRGAVAVVGERHPAAVPELGDIPYVCVTNARAEAGRIASEIFGHPSSQLLTIGVTGTNGKTTVAYWLQHFLRAGLGPTGLSSSVLSDDVTAIHQPQLTTPEGPDLQRLLKTIVNREAVAAVVEVSSHALAQGRVAGVDFAGALFTNLSRDHLDFHGTMEAYAEAKAGLFTQLGSENPAVINADDPWGEWMAHHCIGPVITFGRSAGLVRWQVLRSGPTGMTVQISLPGQTRPQTLMTPIVGVYQAANLVAAYTMAWTLGVSEETLNQQAVDLPAVPGRQQRWSRAGRPTVIIDYAHNPEGLQALLKTVSQWRPRHLSLVFGARGDRDLGKYPEMGRVASHYCRRIWLTTDNPHATPFECLTQAILDGIPDPGIATVVPERQEAVKRAIDEAGPNDIVVVTGRGHEGPIPLADGLSLLPDQALVANALKAWRSEGQNARDLRNNEGGTVSYVRHCRLD